MAEDGGKVLLGGRGALVIGGWHLVEGAVVEGHGFGSAVSASKKRALTPYGRVVRGKYLGDCGHKWVPSTA